jgi:predicted aminopeptidase
MRMLTETPAAGARGSAVVRALLLGAACALLSACGTPYLMQAAGGEWGVLHEREPIDKLLADPDTPPALRAQLEQVHAAREFASHELGLPDNKSYRSYADIGRRYVVWNVVATPEFSVHPKRWCFPVAGCVAYRGYFHEERAREFAADLAVRGYDVAVDGVPAFSTLGKFADPVLSSMLPYGDDELAATIFHELAHQLLYVPDDSEFNEAFATTVEDVGLERWLTHQGKVQRMAAYREDERQEQELVALMARARGELERLYASGLPEEEMRERKAAIFHRLGGDIRALEHREGVSYPLYDEWIEAGLNNARLASVATYFDCVPGFKRLLQEQDNDLPRFYAAVRELARLPRAERHARLCTPPAAARLTTPGSPAAVGRGRWADRPAAAAA